MQSILSAKFYNTLWIASTNRDKRQYVVNKDTPAWVEYERSILLSNVNNERSKRGLSLLTENDIERGEIIGDPNYGMKLAQHCANICK